MDISNDISATEAPLADAAHPAAHFAGRSRSTPWQSLDPGRDSDRHADRCLELSGHPPLSRAPERLVVGPGVLQSVVLGAHPR